jgi:hypothetical protein
MQTLRYAKLVALACTWLAVAACADSNVAQNMGGVAPIPSRETASVGADALVETMMQTGFSREDILEFGPGIRNALATHGGAEVRDGGNVTAIFSVFDGSLYVVSQRGGTLVHPLS